MKKTTLRFYKSIGKTLVFFVVTGMLCIQPVLAMPSVSGSDLLTSVDPSSEKLKVFSYIMQNSLVLKVHFENPAQEKVGLQILNNRMEVVYQKNLGNEELFVGKFNLKELPNGNYTFVIKSPSYTYSRSFSIQTSIMREVNVHDYVLSTIK